MEQTFTESNAQGTALVRFASEAESLRALSIFSSVDAPRADAGMRLHAELRDEAEQPARGATVLARPEGAPRLLATRRREHQRNRRGRELEHLDQLLALIEGDAARQHGLVAERAGALPECAIAWAALPPSLDPCRSARRMQPGTLRGERKRLTVDVFARLLGEALPAALALSATAASARAAGGAALGSPPRELTVVDCGCGTGNLVLPLATLGAAGVRFVGVDLKRRSLQLLAQRVQQASDQQHVPVEPWEGSIEAYNGPCDAVISLHACAARPMRRSRWLSGGACPLSSRRAVSAKSGAAPARTGSLAPSETREPSSAIQAWTTAAARSLPASPRARMPLRRGPTRRRGCAGLAPS